MNKDKAKKIEQQRVADERDQLWQYPLSDKEQKQLLASQERDMNKEGDFWGR
jgi:hypothetical protein